MKLKKEDILFNSQDTGYKSPYGAVSCGTKINFTIKVNEQLELNKIFLILLKDNKKEPSCPERIEYEMLAEERENISGITYINYRVTVDTFSDPELLFYYFQLDFKNSAIIYYGDNYDNLGGEGCVYEEYPKLYQITTYEKYNKTPDWFKKSIIYQIFPDRFFNGNSDGKVNSPKENSFIYGNWYDLPLYVKDSNGEILRWDFHGGNLLGITKKLDYLKDMGISLIYLNPIFKARSNHRYDTGDYKEIDPVLGTEDDFKKLISEAKKRGINIILDGVFNHTGQDSRYFNRFKTYNSIGAYNSKSSKYYDWYDFKEYPNEYECWWGIKDLPNVNELSKSFMNYIIESPDSVVNKWFGMGIKGWRLDVADELPEEFLKALRRKCLENDKESVLLGEVWEDATNKISYGERREYMCGDELDSVTNYSFRNYFLDFFSNKIDSYKLKRLFEKMKENYPMENFYALVNILGTHDVSRILTELKKIAWELVIKMEHISTINKADCVEIIEVKLLKLISLMQMTFFGVPIIYYGDEAGVLGEKDPDNRRTFPWGRENKEILNWYKDIANLRNKNDFFTTGHFEQLTVNEDIYGIVRYSKNGRDVFGEKLNDEKDKLAFIIINKNPEKKYRIKLNINKYLKILNDEQLEYFNSYLDKEKVLINDGEIELIVRPLSSKVLLSF